MRETPLPERLDLSPQPLYRQIHDILYRKIQDREWRSGDQIPTETELAERFRVSKVTVRQALDRLAHDGLILRRQGRGTFVSRSVSTPVTPPLTGLLEDLSDLDAKSRFMVLKRSVVQRPPASPLAVTFEANESLMRLLRVRLDEAGPISYSEAYLPVALGRLLPKNQLERVAVFRLLTEEHKIAIRAVKQVIRADLTPRHVARILKTRISAPILVVDRSYVGPHGPVCFMRVFYRCDRYQLFVTYLPRAGGQFA